MSDEPDGPVVSEPPADPEDPDGFYAEGVSVTARGKITLPARHRNRLGIEHGDVVDVRFFTEDTAFSATDLMVNTHGQVPIPDRKRTLYGVEEGDNVDIEVLTTGLSYDLDE